MTLATTTPELRPQALDPKAAADLKPRVAALQPRALNPDRMGLLIPTLKGLMIGAEGDYIIRGVKGELYPCKPDIFAATYEAV